MTAQFATLDVQSAKPEIVNGRYRIPDPITGKPRLWTRATTFAKSMADEYHLTRWKLRMAATGLAQRHDLYAAVASSLPVDATDPTKDERDRLNALCEQAMDAAGSAKGSNLGTALHDFTDADDSGRSTVIPPPWDADIAAYRAAMDASPYTILPEYIEQVITVPSLGVAGKFDRVLQFADLLRVGDLKTAKSLDLGWGEIAIQLALYAHAETIFDPATQTHRPMPTVDQEKALVMHLPVGRATCKLYEVDIAAGWEAAQLCLGVREWRRRKNLAEQINLVVGAPSEPVHISQPLAVVASTISSFSPDPFAGVPDENGKPRADRAAKRAWLLERRAALIEIDGGREVLASNWPADVPTLMAFDDHSAEQLEQIQKALSVAEGLVMAPFPESDDPTDPANIVVANNDVRIVGLIERLKQLPPDLQAAVVAEAKASKVPQLNGSRRITEAHLSIVEPLVVAAETEYTPRAKRINDALALAAEHNVTEAALCDLLDVSAPLHIYGHVLGQLDDVVDAINHPDRILKERDGVLVVDNPAAVLLAYGNDRRRVLAAGRDAARANGIEIPKDSDAVLSHPLLAAVIAAV